MSIEAARLSVVVDADTDRAEGGLRRMGGVVSGAGAKLATMAAAGVGAAAVLGVGLAKAGMSLQDSLMPIGTLLGSNTAGFKELSGALTSFMARSPQSGEEIGAAAYVALSAGISGTKNVMDALSASQQLAQAGLGDLGGAMDLVTSAVNSFGTEGLTAQSAAEGFFGAISAGKTTTAGLAQGFGSIAPLAAAAGVQFKDLLAATAALTSTGMEASVAYSGIRGALTSIIKPTKEAMNTADELGISFSQAHLKAVGLPAFLNEIRYATGGNVETMGALFGSVEGLNSVLALTGPQAEAFTANLTSIGEAGSKLGERSKQVAATWSNRFAAMKNAVATYGGMIGLKVADWLQPRMQRLVDWVRAHWPQISEVMAAAMERVRVVLERLRPLFDTVVEHGRRMLSWVVEHWPQISAVVGRVVDAVEAEIRFVWTTVFPAIIRAGASVVDWWRDHWPQIRDTVAAVVSWFRDSALPVLRNVIGSIREKASDLIAWWKRTWPAVSEAVRHVMNVVHGVVERVLGFVQALWRNYGDRIMQVVVGVWSMIRATITTAVNIVRGVIETVLAVINGDWGKAWDAVLGLVSGVWDGIKLAVAGGIELVSGLLGGLGRALGGLLGDGWQLLKDGASAAFDDVVGFAASLPGRVLAGLGLLGQMLANLARLAGIGLLNALKAGVEVGWDIVTGLPGRIADAALGLANKVWDAGKTLGDKLLSGLKNGLTAAAGFASDVASGIVKVVKDAWNEVARMINDFVPNKVGWGPFTVNLPDNPIPTFDVGGVMPGRRGAPGFAILHGGETILPTHKTPLGAFMAPARREVPQVVEHTTVIQLDGREIARSLRRLELAQR